LQPDKRLITPDHDLHLLGLSEEYARPEWMILTVMPVPPPPVRPSIAVDGGTMRSEDDLTYELGDIIKASANVRRCEQEGAPAHVIAEFEQLLQVMSHFLLGYHRPFRKNCSFMLRPTWITTLLVFRKLCKSLDDLSKPSAPV
jgi:DNA-directed RNA polymerase beta' subunit